MSPTSDLSSTASAVGVTTFKTLKNQEEFVQPSSTGSHYPELQKLTLPHIESFNSLFTSTHNNGTGSGGLGLLDLAVKDIPKITAFDSQDPASRNKIEFWLSSINVGKPASTDTVIYPSESRQNGTSYKAKMQIKLNWKVNGGPIQTESRSLGLIPVMVKSTKCNLDGKSAAEMVRYGEDADEMGGYFISNGIEKLIRLLIVGRRNYPTAIVRPSFQNRGPTYSPFGVSMRCVRPDQTSQTITLHYCTDGQVILRFSYRKNEYMVPVLLVLRALADASDYDIFQRLTQGRPSDTFLNDRIELLLRSFKSSFGLHHRLQCLSYLGSKFAVMLDSPDDSTEVDVGHEFLKRVILVHLSDNKAKFDQIIFMIQKLYALAGGECAPDNPDSLQFQEVLLPGHLYGAIIKEKLGEWLSAIKIQIQTDLRRSKSSVNFSDKKYISKILAKTSGTSDIGKKLEYFLATGNLISPSGLDLQQTSGYTIVAEKLNFYRYLSHFRSIHRGSFFAELKTTTVRKLLPESWGFLCPVHTPDGSPCGLLNHLSHSCEVVVYPPSVSSLPKLLASLGALQMSAFGPRRVTKDSNDDDDQNQLALTIQLDGQVIGWAHPAAVKKIAETLRDYKVKKMHNVPIDLEIGYVPPSHGGQYPGLYLFSSASRFIRSVQYLPTGTEDYVGPFEQVYMDIACLDEDVVPGITTHREFSATRILSVVANMTPFSDFNQSPRNMYQCQMGKQTMGTPAHNFKKRTDNKLYRLQTGQSPIVRPAMYDKYGLDGYPSGMNAVVCVISYTGYDMEDASILSKSSFERGYGYGTVYKGDWIDLGDHRRKGEPVSHYFGYMDENGNPGFNLSAQTLEHLGNFLDEDGLPMVGVKLKQGDPYYAYLDEVSGKVTVVPFKSMEEAFVDEVRLCAPEGNADGPLQKVHIKLRIPRPPIIGDKFSSRHGQKGVISQKWPSIDMPFSESGIIPDVIINPHAFPSRMTIGMFVESLAGKAGALHGVAQDATPFTFSEQYRAADFFGEQLVKAGYNYHGNEPMYSGITGEEFKADIYLGVVYYQRLRHMVSDKYQVRTTGPVHNLTQQPIKGRKKAGGIRFGEMERDSLLAHGVSYLLQDRLMNCSDYTQAHVCSKCGSILTPVSSVALTNREDNTVRETISTGTTSGLIQNNPHSVSCLQCKSDQHIKIVAVPYVFRYLCTELTAMNVKLKLNID